MTSALLLLEGLILLTLGADLGRGFQGLSLRDRIVLVVIGGGVALLFAWPRARERVGRVWRTPILCLCCAVLFLAGSGLAQEIGARRLRAEWDAGVRDRLEERARILEEDFAWLLDEIARPLEMARVSVPGRTGAFDALERARRLARLPAGRTGLSILARDGSPLAWAGNSTPVPRPLLEGPAPEPRFAVAGDLIPRIYARLDGADDGATWVSEFALRSPPRLGREGTEGEFSLDSLPRWRRAGPAHVHFSEDRPGADELARLFAREGDRYWSRLGRKGVTSLSFPLRSPDGTDLALVTLSDRPASAAVRGLRRRARPVGALLAGAATLAALLLLMPAGRLGAGPRRLLVLSTALWAVRWFLLLAADVSGLPDLAVCDITLYASASLGGLLRSPADLLLTALAVLVQAWLVRREIAAVPIPVRPRRRAALMRSAVGTLLGLVVATGTGLHHLLDRIVLAARLDITHIELDALLAPRLALQASLFSLAVAPALVILVLFDLAARCRTGGRVPALLRWFRSGSADALPFPLRFVSGLLALTVLYVPFLLHAYDRLRREFFEDALMPALLHQEDARARILQESLRTASDPDFAVAAAFALEVDASRSTGLAYRLWTMTAMAERGLASSLRIFDADGRLLGRFASNLAPMLEVRFDVAAAAVGRGPRVMPPGPHVTVRKDVLFGSRWVRPPRRPPLLVVLSVVDDYDNLPVLASGSIDPRTLGDRGLPRTNPELARFPPLIAVFGPGMERLYESGGEIPPPDPVSAVALAEGRRVWLTRDVGEGPASVLYARADGATYALARPHPGPVELLAVFLRLFLLNGLMAGALVVVGRAVARVAEPPRRKERPETTFYARLLAVFVLSALIPLLALALFFTRFSAREFASHSTTAGLGALQVARRIAEDYLTVTAPQENPRLDDDVIFWLGRVVGQNLSVYRGDTLLATSTRELYSSGLLNTRLRGEVYRAIYLDREPFLVSETPREGRASLTLYAPMRVDPEGTPGVIAVPLAAQRRAAARRIDELRDAILISTCLTVLLLAAVGWLVARRVSRPIARLSRAARRVAAGDLEVRVPATGRDEIAALIGSFNRMASALKAQRDDLQRRKDYIEMILRSATTGVVSTDARGSIITINPAAQQLLSGRTGPPRAGEDLVERLGRDRSLEPLRAALAGGPGGQGEAGVDVAIVRGDEERRLRAVFLPFAPVPGEPPGRIILLEDVTDVVRSGRLAAWADMARRIAHDIKNPLTPIQLNVEHLRRVWNARDSRFGEVLAECLENIQAQVHNLRTIAAEFLAYARLPKLRPERTPVAALLDEALAPYAAAPPPGVRLRREAPADLPDLLADRAVITRVLVNLIENALQAMPSGGTLTVAASASLGRPGRPAVRIEVRDTGAGIEAAVLPRLFEPYFSTRSGGTGLGLAIARRAVEEHGGSIEIRSRPNQGTVVAITLPAAGHERAGAAS